MKKLIIVIFMTATICGLIRCKNNYQGEVNISYSKDTIAINDTLIVELRIDHTDSILPKFCIISNRDTVILPFDQEKDCGLFKAIGRISGEVNYYGFVSAIGKDGQEKTDKFKIVYNVK